MADALDVASYQRELGPDFGNAGLVLAKVSEGVWSSNPYAAQQVGATLVAGLRVGAYHFPRPDRYPITPEDEAATFVAQARAAGAWVPGVVLALDMEPYPGIAWPFGPAGTVDYMDRWFRAVASGGLPPAAELWWYSYPGFLYLTPADMRIDTAKLWIADPSNAERGLPPRTDGRTWALWQVGQGPHPGVAGNVDLNVYGPDYTRPATPAEPITGGPEDMGATVNFTTRGIPHLAYLTGAGDLVVRHDEGGSSIDEYLAGPHAGKIRQQFYGQAAVENPNGVGYTPDTTAGTVAKVLVQRLGVSVEATPDTVRISAVAGDGTVLVIGFAGAGWQGFYVGDQAGVQGDGGEDDAALRRRIAEHVEMTLLASPKGTTPTKRYHATEAVAAVYSA